MNPDRLSFRDRAEIKTPQATRNAVAVAADTGSADDRDLFVALSTCAFHYNKTQNDEWRKRHRTISGELFRRHENLIWFVIRMKRIKENFEDIYSVGAETLYRAICWFDPWSAGNYKFSTLAITLLQKSITWRGSRKIPKLHMCGSNVFDELVLEAPNKDIDSGMRLEEIREVLLHNFANLNASETQVIIDRYWRDQTLNSTGLRLSRSKERVRQLELSALNKLRECIERMEA